MKARSPQIVHLAHTDVLGGTDLLHATYVQQHFSKHFHDGYALGIIDRGALAFRYQGKDLIAEPQDINLVVPGEVHDGHDIGPHGWTYRMLYLQPQVLLRATEALDLHPHLPDFATGVLRDPELAQTIKMAFTLLTTSEDRLEKESILLSLLCTWISRHAEEKPRTHLQSAPEAARRAKEYLHAHFADTVSLEELARTANMSPYHLIKVFRHALGVTPHAYQTQLRASHARTLLQGAMSMADVAFACGFSDQSHLSRIFKSHYGLTPGQYRNFIQNT